MKQTTKVLSVLLALLMAFSVTAFAAQALTITSVTTYKGEDLEGATVQAGTDITIVFSNNVTDESVYENNTGKIKVRDADSSEVNAEVYGSGEDKTVIVVALPNDLAKGTYTLTIGKDVTAKNGTTLGEKKEYTFTVKGSGTGTGGGDKKLEVASVTLNGQPLEGATVKTGDTIVILFSNGMVDHGAESAKMIRIIKSDGTSVSCDVTYPQDKSDDVAKKQFTVVVGFIDEGQYELILGPNMQANNGNKLGEEVRIAFTVQAEEKLAEPTFLERLAAYFNGFIDRIVNAVKSIFLNRDFVSVLNVLKVSLQTLFNRIFPKVA